MYDGIGTDSATGPGCIRGLILGEDNYHNPLLEVLVIDVGGWGVGVV